MSEEELIETLRAFEKNRVEQLEEPAKNLFYAIMEIADERDRLNNIINELEKENRQLKKRLTTYQILHRDCNIDNLKNISKIERLNNIINEAIEYIKKHGDYNKLSGCIEELDLYKINELLDILKGSEKE